MRANVFTLGDRHIVFIKFSRGAKLCFFFAREYIRVLFYPSHSLFALAREFFGKRFFFLFFRAISREIISSPSSPTLASQRAHSIRQIYDRCKTLFCFVVVVVYSPSAHSLSLSSLARSRKYNEVKRKSVCNMHTLKLYSAQRALFFFASLARVYNNNYCPCLARANYINLICPAFLVQNLSLFYIGCAQIKYKKALLCVCAANKHFIVNEKS